MRWANCRKANFTKQIAGKHVFKATSYSSHTVPRVAEYSKDETVISTDTLSSWWSVRLYHSNFMFRIKFNHHTCRPPLHIYQKSIVRTRTQIWGNNDVSCMIALLFMCICGANYIGRTTGCLSQRISWRILTMKKFLK